MTEASVAGPSAIPITSISTAVSPVDVETTNWNAVKIFAVQHQLSLRLLEAARDAVIAQPAEHTENHDFGSDTPYHITVARLDTGRVIFRFRSRQSRLDQSDAQPSTMAQHEGMPRSSSSGAIFTRPPPDSPDAHQPVPKMNLANTLLRKTGNLSLKHSRSIPVLRRKASANLAPASSPNTAASSSGGAPPPATNSTLADNLLSHTHLPASALPLVSASRAVSDHHQRDGQFQAKRGAVGHSITMARAGSTPVSGPYANRQAPDYIQEGDVLGAVLGLGQADLWSSAHADTSSRSHRRRSCSGSFDSSQDPSVRPKALPDVRLPEGSFDTRFTRQPRFHQLREAQSFESNASDATARGREDPDMQIDSFPAELHPFLPSDPSSSITAPPGTLVFDVMQCYRRPSPEPSQYQLTVDVDSDIPASIPASGITDLTDSTAINAQAQSLQTSAAPGDDPRFAVWAVRSDRNDGTFVISNRAGQTDDRPHSELASSMSDSPELTNKRPKRRSRLPFGDDYFVTAASPGSTSTSSPASERKTDPPQRSPPSGKAVLLAASAARLVAELTAEIDLDLRSDFFYTYRAFMSPMNLLELLILRFEWAVSEPSSAADEARRRIVRVRTYVVIKHWLQHHFDFDFLPSRALRQRLATWLNTTAKDTRIATRPADLNIINSLRKVVRALKETYSQSGVGGLLFNDAGRLADSPASHPKTNSLSTLGSSSHDSESSIAATSSPASSREHRMSSSGSMPSIAEDVNLDFAEDTSSHDAPHNEPPLSGRSQPSSPQATRADLSDATRAAAQKAAAESVLVSHRHTLAPVPTHLARSTSSAPSPSLLPSPMPHGSSALSRAFAQTASRISKLKRALGSRGLGMNSNHDVDAEAEECSDLLFSKGGLDSLLQFFATERSRRQSLLTSRDTKPLRQRPLSRTDEVDEEQDEGPASQASEDSTGQEETPSLVGASTNRSTPASSIDLARLSDKHASHDDGAHQGLGIDMETSEQHGGESSLAAPGQDLFGLDPASIQPLDSLAHMRPKVEECLHHAASEQTLRSVSRMPVGRDSVGVASVGKTNVQRRQSTRDSLLSNGAPRIVQIDDIDLSSDEDDFAVRKALRRLPGARDLRQANTIRDLEPQSSAAGRDSVDSMASSMFRHAGSTRHVHVGSFGMGHARGVSVDSALLGSEHLGVLPQALQPALPVITTVQSEMLDPDEALQGYELVKGFRLDDIESDDEEPGDVEAALRRLEGIIDEDRQKQKANRVERLWQRSMARNAKVEDRSNATDKRSSESSLHSKGDRTLSSSLTGGSLADAEDEISNASVHPCDSSSDTPLDATRPRSSTAQPKELRAQSSFLDLRDSVSTSESGVQGEERLAGDPTSGSQRRSAEDVNALAVADGIGRPASHTNVPQRAVNLLGSPKSGLPNTLPVHRSFLLSYGSGSVARQMCLIEAELLRSVSWDELASSRWRERRFGAEVTDWEAFYRDRVRDRLEAQRLGEMHQERAVEAIVARFNLTSNWVASEVVLTQNIDERAAVISKLIRIAWKCYLHSNFASLAQIIFGLSTPWVERLRRTWNRVGYFEMRMWRDLNSFVGPRHNFRHLRNAMLKLVESSAGDSGPADFSSTPMAAETSKTASARSCVPFFGLFVSDLMQYDAMPSFLDPTSPTMAATTTTSAQDGNVRMHPADPNAFDGLAPLPAGVVLEPLINVLKFRSIAEVIRQISAFQNAAKNYATMFEAEKGAYVRCLKLRCLPGELLARLSHMAES
ncbi:Guanine nucleotide exchange factor LTE1 [Pseudozyma hubeiensis]|nr:Guanine nucleotide exchange factor LTE1 [Pseudozyma hubeiensis]